MRFVVLGDLHYSDYLNVDHAMARDRIFAQLFAQIRALKPDLVFAVGDTTNVGAMTEIVGLETIAEQHQTSWRC